jgi:hypothetical protein
VRLAWQVPGLGGRATHSEGFRVANEVSFTARFSILNADTQPAFTVPLHIAVDFSRVLATTAVEDDRRTWLAPKKCFEVLARVRAPVIAQHAPRNHADAPGSGCEKSSGNSYSCNESSISQGVSPYFETEAHKEASPFWERLPSIAILDQQLLQPS